MKVPHKISHIVGDGVEYRSPRWEASRTGTELRVCVLRYRAMETFGESRYICMDAAICYEDWGGSSATRSGQFVVSM
jgi:hypothetical protein